MFCPVSLPPHPPPLPASPALIRGPNAMPGLVLFPGLCKWSHGEDGRRIQPGISVDGMRHEGASVKRNRIRPGSSHWESRHATTGNSLWAKRDPGNKGEDTGLVPGFLSLPLCLLGLHGTLHSPGARGRQVMRELVCLPPPVKWWWGMQGQ